MIMSSNLLKLQKERIYLLEMGPDLTQAHFWSAIKKRLTHLWPAGTVWPDPKRLFRPEGILGEIFQTQTKNVWPGSIRATKNWPNLTCSKNVWPSPITTIFLSRKIISDWMSLHKHCYNFCFWEVFFPCPDANMLEILLFLYDVVCFFMLAWTNLTTSSLFT